MEADGSALGAVAQEVLDQAEADIARVALPDRIELDDGPLVAMALALDPEQAADPPVELVDVQQVVRLERAQRQPEQAEHAHPGAGDRQPERAGGVRLGEPGELAERREIGQASHPDLARHGHLAVRSRRTG